MVLLVLEIRKAKESRITFCFWLVKHGDFRGHIHRGTGEVRILHQDSR